MPRTAMRPKTFQTYEIRTMVSCLWEIITGLDIGLLIRRRFCYGNLLPTSCGIAAVIDKNGEGSSLLF